MLSVDFASWNLHRLNRRMEDVERCMNATLFMQVHIMDSPYSVFCSCC